MAGPKRPDYLMYSSTTIPVCSLSSLTVGKIEGRSRQQYYVAAPSETPRVWHYKPTQVLFGLRWGWRAAVAGRDESENLPYLERFLTTGLPVVLHKWG